MPKIMEHKQRVNVAFADKRRSFFRKITSQKQLLLITVPFLLFIFVFNYLPLWGWIMAFQNYKPYLGISGSGLGGTGAIQAAFLG